MVLYNIFDNEILFISLNNYFIWIQKIYQWFKSQIDAIIQIYDNKKLKYN